MFLVRLFLEVRAGLFHKAAEHRLLQFEFHLLVLHLTELQQLVHHAQHTLAVTLHDLQLAADALTDALVLQYIIDRRYNERQRRT